MKHTLLAATAIAALAFAPAVNAAQIITFGQTSSTNTITGSASGGVTTISGTNVGVDITQIDATLATPLPAFLTLSATSTGPATLSGANDVQNFSGTFTITSGANDTGTNYLSGNFTDSVAEGPPTGQSLTLGVAQPPDILNFTSGVITTLGTPNGLSFALTNVTPGVQIDTTTPGSPTLGSFGASISGNASASATSVPEPASLAVLGVGLLGLGFVASRKRSV